MSSDDQPGGATPDAGPPAGPAAAALPPLPPQLPALPTQQCPHCANVTPAGSYCGVCGAHLAHADDRLAARRPHAFSANPEEPVLRVSVISSLFPHLSHRSAIPFRIGLTLLAGLLIVFSATGLEAPVIALSAMGLPLLFQMYVYEVDVYEDNHVLLTAETLLIGAGLGLVWALVGGPIVSHALQPTLGASLGGFDVVKAAVFVPIVGQALMLLPLLLVIVQAPAFGGRRESLDGFTLGAAAALGFTFAAIVTNLASRLSAGVVTHRPFTSVLSEALIRGISEPIVAAAATGLVGASIWVKRAEKGTTGATGRWLTSPLLILVTVLAVQVGVGFGDQARLADIPLLAVHLAAAAVLLLALRVGLHHIILHEQHDVTIGESSTCPHCYHLVPRMPFCPVCGVARVATTKRHGGRALGLVLAPDDSEAGPAAPAGWPTLPVAAAAETWSGYPLASSNRSPQGHRAHHTYVISVFTAGLATVTVALVLTAVFSGPDTTPVQRCRHGFCPGALTLSAAGVPAPPPSPVQTFNSGDGKFSVVLFPPSVDRFTSQGPTNPSLVSIEFQPISLTAGKSRVQLGGGVVQVGDFSGEGGSSAQQVVDNLVAKDAPSATLAYPVQDPMVGYVPGYGGVYDDVLNSSTGTQEDVRLLVMAAVNDGVAVVVWAEGPQDASFPSLPLLDHPSFVDLDIALFSLDPMIDSIVWKHGALSP